MCTRMSCYSESSLKQLQKNNLGWDFPGDPVEKNLPSTAGDTGSIPGRGTKIPHAAGQLSPCATTTEPACRKLHSPRAVEPSHH